MAINRNSGDETPIQVSWSGEADFSDVTGIVMNVYDDAQKTTLIETLTGEIRGFSPYTYFPIINANWAATRFYQFVISRGAEDKPTTIDSWTQV